MRVCERETMIFRAGLFNFQAHCQKFNIAALESGKSGKSGAVSCLCLSQSRHALSECKTLCNRRHAIFGGITIIE